MTNEKKCPAREKDRTKPNGQSLVLRDVGKGRRETEITKSERSATREIDMRRDLISPDLGNGEVVHIPGNPVNTETVHIRGDLDDIGTGHSPRSQGNIEIAHVLGRIKLGTQSPRRRGGLETPPWML